MRRRYMWVATGLLAGTISLHPGKVEAQGFGIYEHGACAMGRAGAAVASPCADGSAMFFNPAGLAGIDRQSISGGATLIAPSGGFTNDFSGIR
ncbi:MAG: OmpP1/FadL family transporter, partial [Gemmatimonadales bacterium]